MYSQFRLMYCNPAWNRFARSNGEPQLVGGAVVGCNQFDVIPEALRAVYSNAFQQVRSTGRVWEHLYECSSPTLFRIYRMRIHLLKPQDWFIVTNTLVIQRAHENPVTADLNVYADANGIVTMCAHCRCSRRLDNPHQWDFVPEYLERRTESTVRVSHGLCPVCYSYFYRLN